MATTSRSDRLVAGAALWLPLAVILVLHGYAGASYVATTMLVLFAAKLVVSYRERLRRRVPDPRSTAHLSVCAVMPLHNEDPRLAVACVASLLAQTRSIDRIHVIDDGSTDDGAAASSVEVHLALHGGGHEWEVTRLPANVGKRRALAVGFAAADRCDIFLCIDSDTVLAPDAVEQGLQPFNEPDVVAVAGFVTALNWHKNTLTRLIDLRYVSAFLAERAAYSYFGAVLCCCGSLSFYRAPVIRANLEDFVSQQFLGREATFGDDRRLTNYALRAGRVVLCERSRAETAVPERMTHYVRQQIRWNKSFIRESAWVLGTFPLGHGAFWLTALEVVAWLVVGSLTLGGVVVLPLVLDLDGLAMFAAVAGLAAYARTASYLGHLRPGIGRLERLAVFLLAPAYAVIHIGLLLPLRFWSLFTLRRTGWGTRSEVEVCLA